MPRETFHYSNDEITIVWKPNICIHSKICWTNLRQVFDPTQKPWIKMEGADTATIIEQIKKCPSGALSYTLNQPIADEQQIANTDILDIQISPNGPIIISTDCQITNSDGMIETKKGKTALCRCGASNNKPYCDGTHRKVGFEG